MFLSHYATFLITSCGHNFEDYVRSVLYMVLRLLHQFLSSAANHLV